jgi:hypothetical protein
MEEKETTNPGDPLMATPPRHVPPVTGTCRWVTRPRVLKINATTYTVVHLPGRYRLLNWFNGNAYDVEARGRWCTCPSYVWFHCPVQANGDGRCKHIAALRNLGLLPSPSDQPETQQARDADDVPGPDVVCVVEPDGATRTVA